MQGMATLHYAECAPFLEASLRDSNLLVRGNAALALSDLRIADASALVLSMFANEQDTIAIQYAAGALRTLGVKAAAPSIREKISVFNGQTRSTLIQVLGTLGSDDDLPLIAGYLNDAMGSEIAATRAVEELAGVNFGPLRTGIGGYPPPELIAARAWWASHKDAWPRCDDCHPSVIRNK